MTRCVHDMLPDQCAYCTGRDGGEAEHKARRARLLRIPGVITSGYPGRCGGCGTPFGPGTPLMRAADDSAWVAECCIDDTSVPDRG